MKRGDRFHIVYDHEWFNPIKRGFKQQCCDCGLTHTINFKVRKSDLKISMQFIRDKRATAQCRRQRRITAKKKYYADK